MKEKMKQQISIFKLNKKELKKIKGGFCGCACYYANCGGSSSADNGSANNAGGKISLPPADPENPC